MGLRAASPAHSIAFAGSTSSTHHALPGVSGQPQPPVLTPCGPTDKLLQTKGPETRTLQLPLWETGGPVYYDQEGQIQGGRRMFVYQPFSTTNLLNWKNHTPSYTEKLQALTDLLQSIIQTHRPTWADCCYLLLTLFNTEERQ